MTKPRVILLLALPMCLGADPSVENVLDQVRSGVKSEQAMDYMRRVYSTDRWFTFPKFQQTAEYLKQAMTDAGLQKVELLGAPADGVGRQAGTAGTDWRGCTRRVPGAGRLRESPHVAGYVERADACRRHYS